jgi:hypothetical protein
MKSKLSGIVGLFLIGTLVMSSCKSSEKAVSASDQGEVLLETYCHGDQYLSTPKALRASSIGESMDQMTAKKKAMSDARAQLAAAVNTKIKGVTDSYVKSGNFNNKEELLQNFETLNREVVNQSLSGTYTICEKMTRTKQGNYKSYVCIELGSNEILQNLNNRMSNEEMLKVDYNYEKFKKTFEDEMNKIGQ